MQSEKKETKEASAVPAWTLPFFGVIAMFTFAAFVGQRRRQTATRQVNFIHEPVLDEESFMSEWDSSVE